jgi:NADH-quinone oxidoreductase subunit G
MSEQTNVVNLTINGKAISVPKGTTVYQAALQLGIDIPIFCYHDRMPPFGACRMCLVEIEKMPKLQTSCTLEAKEGMVVKTHSAMALEGREGILELLLINHPLDCPICDRGGECPLQEHAFAHGPGQSRFFEEKRHFKKPVPRGPVLMLDRERCIVCARCTRFGDLVAGDHALEFIERGFKTEVGTPDDGPAESKFIGNTIMICPVGALTSQVYRFRARPWDNEPAETTCALCPVGCRMFLDSRDGEIMRTRSKEDRQVNDIWLCDKGWFGYEFTSHPDRLQQPLVRRGGNLEATSWDEAISLIADKIKQAKPNGKLAALGGNPLTVEENYLFQKLMREGAGVNHVDHRVGVPIISLDDEGIEPGMEMSIGECEELSYAFLLGLDITEEFPVIWLRLKQAINCGAKVIFIGNFAPEIAPHLAKTVLHAPGKELETLTEHLHEMDGKKGAIFVGRQYLYTPHRQAILSQLLKVRQTTPNLTLNILEGRNNSMGARFAGMRPDLGPNHQRLETPGFDTVKILENASNDGWDFLYVAGANPAVKYPSDLWNRVREKLGFLVVQDIFLTETAEQADVVLPILSYVEKGGSLINIEGRIRTIQPGKIIPEGVYSDADIFNMIAEKLNLTLTIDQNFRDALKSARLPFPRPQNISTEQAMSPNSNQLLATFAPALFDHGVRMKHDVQLVQMAKEPRVRLHPNDGTKRGIQDGDEVRLKANEYSITAKIKLDDRVAENTIVLPLGFEQVPTHELGTNLLNGIPIEIQKE